MSELKANSWFCSKSVDAQKVFKDEYDYAEGAGKSHKRICKDFNKKYTFETMIA